MGKDREKRLIDSKNSIVVIGDVMLDRYLYGKVSRISPEAPVPVLDYEFTDNRPGGAANVALNIKALGSDASLIAVKGDDEEGEELTKLLNESDICTDNLITYPGVNTTLKTRVMARNQQLLRVDRETRQHNNAELENTLINVIESVLVKEPPDGIILQDYNKGVLSPGVIQHTISIASKYGIPMFVDPKIENIKYYGGCTLFKPNLKEAEEILGHKIEVKETELDRISQRIQEIIQCEIVLITLSDKGLFLKRVGESGVYIPALQRAISDVCGAGDTVISTVAVSYLNGFDDEQIARISNLAGHIVCRFPGVVPIDIKMLKSEMNL